MTLRYLPNEKVHLANSLLKIRLLPPMQELSTFSRNVWDSATEISDLSRHIYILWYFKTACPSYPPVHLVLKTTFHVSRLFQPAATVSILSGFVLLPGPPPPPFFFL